MPACSVAIDFPAYHPQSCHHCRCWTMNWSCRSGIHENGHHVAWDPAAEAAAALVPGPEGALGPVPAPGPKGALEAVPVHLAESPARAAVAVAAAAEGAAALVVIRGGRDQRRILRSWLTFSTPFANPSTPTLTSLFPTSSTFAYPLLASMPLFPKWLLSFQTYSVPSLLSPVPPS